jgi:hypothetical protein
MLVSGMDWGNVPPKQKIIEVKCHFDCIMSWVPQSPLFTTVDADFIPSKVVFYLLH